MSANHLDNILKNPFFKKLIPFVFVEKSKKMLR